MFNKTEHISYSLLLHSNNMDSICIHRSVHWQQFHLNGNLICMQCLMCYDLVSSKWINFRGRAKSCHWYVACLVRRSGHLCVKYKPYHHTFFFFLCQMSKDVNQWAASLISFSVRHEKNSLKISYVKKKKWKKKANVPIEQIRMRQLKSN